MTLKGIDPHSVYKCIYASPIKIMTFRQAVPEMYLLATVLVLFTSHAARSAEQAEHRDFQYNSVVDPMTGRYNFAYDTGNDNNEIAHAMHMQYRDANGIVRGRYGYTDPRGKLRVVEYEAGPKGFVARGDVGPDQALHEQSPETQQPQTASFTQDEGDLQLDPRPVQMAGWEPLQNPMVPSIASTNADTPSQGEIATGTAGESDGFDGYSTTNITDTGAVETYIPVFDPYDDRYPRLTIFTKENPGGRELETLSDQASGTENTSEANGEAYPVASPETINSIDVNPDEIREAASGQQATVARSADGDSSTSSRTLPYSYRNYLRRTHDHAGEIAYPYRSVYIPSHGHYHYIRQPHNHDAERGYYYANRQTHDHAAERRYHDHDAERRYYVVNRQTHDHDAEKRYASNRQTHDHDAEKKYASNRQTHDHDAERRYYYANGRTHDHDAERAYYYNTIHRQNNPHRRRIFYRDNHSMAPHEHYNDIYHNDRSHQHSDVQLYGTSQNLKTPPTEKPGELKYISSDKYHDKYYYWGN